MAIETVYLVRCVTRGAGASYLRHIGPGGYSWCARAEAARYAGRAAAEDAADALDRGIRGYYAAAGQPCPKLRIEVAPAGGGAPVVRRAVVMK